jgi:hypothetical protein
MLHPLWRATPHPPGSVNGMSATKRPALGKLRVGDKVYVDETSRRGANWREATVTRVARVWVTIKADGGCELERRFRMDSQSIPSDYGYRMVARFVTPEQRAWDEKLSVARKLIHEARISFMFASPWGRPGGVLKLAELLSSVSDEEIASWSES